MSEHLLKVLLKELKTVRIVCKHRIDNGDSGQVCGAVVEVPVERLQNVKACPLCGNAIHPIVEIKEDPFRQLGLALAGLESIAGAEFSFVLPGKE